MGRFKFAPAILLSFLMSPAFAGSTAPLTNTGLISPRAVGPCEDGQGASGVELQLTEFRCRIMVMAQRNARLSDEATVAEAQVELLRHDLADESKATSEAEARWRDYFARYVGAK